MKLSDISNGPDFILWIAFVIFVIMAVVLVSGHGSGLIAGYNTAKPEEKEKYDEKKLCRTVGIGLAVIAALILVMGLFENVLPAVFAYVSLGIVVVDVIVVIVLENTICRKK